MKQEEFIKRYTYDPVTDQLGKGGFGSVFKAYDNVLDCYVAIKIAPVDANYSYLRLKNEVDKAARLEHVNIAHYDKCLSFKSLAGEVDIAVMQYYENGSLNNIMDSGILDAEHRYDILTQILEGLAYLHSEGIIHRDLKPQNVLIARRGNRYIPKITDFGISKQLDEGQSSAVSNSVLGGTRAYASPEQLKERTIRKNTDLWSFGVIAYQMLVGALPFNCGSYSPTSEEGRQEQFRQMMSGLLPEALNDVPEPWQRLIRECLTVDNEKRIAHAEDCLAIIHGEETTAVAIEVDNPDTQLDGDSEKAVEPEPQPEPKVAPKPEPKVAPKPELKPVSASKPTEPKKKSKWWLWLLLLAIVGGGVFAYLSSQPKNNPKPTDKSMTIVPDTIEEVDSVEIVPMHTEEPDPEPEPEPEPTPAPDPVLCLTSDSRVTVEHGDSNGTIRYTLENPVSGVNLSVRDDASWLTTSRSGNTISYSASANESQSSRTATITVRYGDQSFEVVITQNGIPLSAPTGYSNGYGYVDLGLPSGLKWATCNVGASNPGSYGNYYAWGETTTKSSYTEDNCSTWEQNIGYIACTNRDAARQNWGGRWRMPKRAEIDELINNCTWTWTTQNNHNGYRVTGPNGNSIFLPAAGCREGSSTLFVGSYGFYWSSTPKESGTQSAYSLDFYSGDHSRDRNQRYFGFSVRPVLE